MAADDWTEKYRPQTLNDVIGNPSAVAAMRQWAKSWEKGIPQYRALVLMGTPGIGKTSSAEALAREMGWGIVEMNASDQRTGSAIENIALRASYFNTFDADGSFKSTRDGGMKLIVLDEADSLYGNSDRGAMPAIVELIRTARQPVILICNDFYELSRKSTYIKSETQQISFRKPQTAAISKVLLKICAKERVMIEEEAIQKIAENAEGDLRAAVRDLQSLALGHGQVTADMAQHLSQRESRSDMFEFIHALLKKHDATYAKLLLRECDVDPPTVAIWIDENLPKNVANRRELAAAYDALSKADVFLGRVSRRMNYGLWSYANDMMVDGVCNELKTPTMGFSKVDFPTYLMKMSRSRSSRAVRNSLALKLGNLLHTSGRNILNDALDNYRLMAQNDEEFRIMLIRQAGLEDNELAFLLGVKTDDKKVKASMKLAFPPEEKEKTAKVSRPRAKKADAGPVSLEVPKKKTSKKAEPVAEKPTQEPKAEPAPPAAPAPAEPVPAPEPVKTQVPETVTEQPKPAPSEPKKARQKSLFDF